MIDTYHTLFQITLALSVVFFLALMVYLPLFHVIHAIAWLTGYSRKKEILSYNSEVAKGAVSRITPEKKAKPGSPKTKKNRHRTAPAAASPDTDFFSQTDRFTEGFTEDFTAEERPAPPPENVSSGIDYTEGRHPETASPYTDIFSKDAASGTDIFSGEEIPGTDLFDSETEDTMEIFLSAGKAITNTEQPPSGTEILDNQEI